MNLRCKNTANYVKKTKYNKVQFFCILRIRENTVPTVIMAALRSIVIIVIADIIFLPCGFFLLFSSPNLSRRRLDVYDTSTHDVALVQI